MNTVRVALRQPELRRRLVFTVAVIGLFRLGSAIPAPGVSAGAVGQCLGSATNGAIGLVNLFSGGALLKLSIFALGVTPYITASIIVQLLTTVIPRFEALRHRGGDGQQKLLQYTRYLTVALGLIEAASLIVLSRGAPSQLFPQCQARVLPNTSVLAISTLVLAMTAGTAVVMWLAEQVTTRGVGNGMSLLIFSSIVARLPSGVATLGASAGWVKVVLGGLVAVAAITGVVFVELGQRRIPVTYPRRTFASHQGSSSTHLPLKINQAGVIPILFASSLLYVPALAAQIHPSNSGIFGFITSNFSSGTGRYYLFAYLGLTWFFAHFYVAVAADVNDLSRQLSGRGAFVPGVRPGAATAGYLGYVQSRLTAAGGFYLCALALLPYLASIATHGGQALLFGGTSLLIVVSVALDTVRQIESQASTVSYETRWLTGRASILNRPRPRSAVGVASR